MRSGRARWLGSFILWLNAFFFITVFSNLATRISQGFVTVELLPYMIVGIIAIQIGCLAGSKLSGHIDMEAMKKSVYGVMIFAGIIGMLSTAEIEISEEALRI